MELGCLFSAKLLLSELFVSLEHSVNITLHHVFVVRLDGFTRFLHSFDFVF